MPVPFAIYRRVAAAMPLQDAVGGGLSAAWHATGRQLAVLHQVTDRFSRAAGASGIPPDA